MSTAYFVPQPRTAHVQRTRLVDIACSQMPALVLVRGSQGMGKSALGVQIAARAESLGATVVWVTLGAESPLLWPAICAQLLATGLVQPGELPDELPTANGSPVWADLKPLVARVGRLVVVCDGFDSSMIHQRGDRLIAALEALSGVHLVLLGGDM